jgi:hypothetical protein
MYIKLIDKLFKKVYIKGMSYSINFDERKNQILKVTRGIGFYEIMQAIHSGKIIGNEKHFNEIKYPNQHLFIININNQACLVPYVIDKNKKEAFFKTLYISRKFTKLYKKKLERNNEQNHTKK